MRLPLNTMLVANPPDYNRIAGFYQRHWCQHYHPGLIAMLDRLLVSKLPPRARVLDVCCGTGTVARYLAQQGLRVTGIDSSEQMLRYAHEQVPGGEFVVADARDFRVASEFDAALCTFDSVSYMLSTDDLISLFSSVHAALAPHGVFIFDVSLEETYKREWQRTCSVIDDEEACFIRGTYDQTERIGRTFITRFHRDGSWQRTDVDFVTRCYDLRELSTVAKRSGFSEVRCHRSSRDPRLMSELGPGRACVVAVK